MGQGSPSCLVFRFLMQEKKDSVKGSRYQGFVQPLRLQEMEPMSGARVSLFSSKDKEAREREPFVGLFCTVQPMSIQGMEHVSSDFCHSFIIQGVL